MYKWARNHDKCIKCGTDKVKHKSRGRCYRCYDNDRYLKRKDSVIERQKKKYLEKIYPRIKLRYKLAKSLNLVFRKNIDRSIKTNSAEYRRIFRLTYRKKLIEVYGGKCARCGFSDYRALQIDHINGGGYKEMKNKVASTYYYNILKEVNKSKYQVLCANCNWIKRYENKECPVKL